MTSVNFYPIIQGLEKIEPVVLSSEYNKSTFFSKEEKFSIKSCPGVRDLLNLGCVIPLWQDMLIRYDDRSGIEVIPSGNMIAHDGSTFFDVQFHENKSLAGYSFGEEYFDFVMKIRCPWYIKTPSKVTTLMLPIQYTGNSVPFTVAPGIITTNEYPMLLLQIVLKKFQGEILLKKGTPMCQLIFIAEQPNVRIHKDDIPIRKNINIVKNWLYSKMHSVVQYRNLKRIL